MQIMIHVFAARYEMRYSNMSEILFRTCETFFLRDKDKMINKADRQD